MSNFHFLHPEWPEFHEHARAVENLVYYDPRGACARARYLIERVVLWMYENDDLTLPFDTSLYNIIQQVPFKKIVGRPIFMKIDAIRKLGNIALHEDQTIREENALRICQEVFHVMYWFDRTYSEQEEPKPSRTFNPELVPRIRPDEVVSARQILAMEEELREKTEQIHLLQQTREGREKELARHKREIKQLRLQSRRFADHHDYNEAQTRELLIDVLLRESGWDPSRSIVREFEVTGMPTKTAVGHVDYVLWDDNGMPLALVEAKRASRNFEDGLHQAALYADCLEKMYGTRPVIFVTNGYEISIWDDRDGPPREVLGFYSKESLQTHHFQIRERKPILQAPINEQITGRYYQKAAIRRVAERFEKGYRRALLVMATGTGKTRVAISLSDLLLRNNWAKRVLFLADRDALVRQAHKSFKSLLPDVPLVNLVDEKNDTSARIVISTYPTMLNQIEKLEMGRRRFDPGYFDLVIIDEAHRSVYNKYGAIFHYFDALMVGLTATPKESVDRDTYGLFHTDVGNPTYAYELSQGVDDNYLVPPRKVPISGKFLSEGIHYSELSEEEKRRYEELFADDETGLVPDHIDASQLNKWLFNRDTVEKVLEQLMEKGLKVEGGDRLGKTIIFAKNQRHASFIREVFDENYPHYAGRFARVIHSNVDHAKDLIDQFCSSEQKYPVIAISVDMMDTGVDAPDVVNLVIFKPVFSRMKFHQMIGRGTRLRPDLFGPGKDKEFFLVFDFCGNFEFFDENPEGYKAVESPSLHARIFEKRLLLAAKLRRDPWKHDKGLQAYREELLDLLHAQVAGLERQSIQVRPHLKMIDRLAERSVWDHLQSGERKEIVQHLAELIPVELNEDELSRRFDLLMLTLQHEWLDGVLQERQTRQQVMDLARNLWSKRHIPAIADVKPRLEKVLSEEFWQQSSLPDLEETRRELRGLMKLIDRPELRPVYSDFEDEFTVLNSPQPVMTDPVVDPELYLQRLETFLEEHKNHLIIEKIRRAQPLTDKDVETLEELLIESDPEVDAEEMRRAIGGRMELIRFIRSATGLKREAVMQKFEEFLRDKELSSHQIEFLDRMIDYYTRKGQLDVADLYEPPFSFLDEDGIDGVFRDKANVVELIIDKVHELNRIQIG